MVVALFIPAADKATQNNRAQFQRTPDACAAILLCIGTGMQTRDESPPLTQRALSMKKYFE